MSLVFGRTAFGLFVSIMAHQIQKTLVVIKLHSNIASLDLYSEPPNQTMVVQINQIIGPNTNIGETIIKRRDINVRIDSPKNRDPRQIINKKAMIEKMSIGQGMPLLSIVSQQKMAKHNITTIKKTIRLFIFLSS